MIINKVHFKFYIVSEIIVEQININITIGYNLFHHNTYKYLTTPISLYRHFIKIRVSMQLLLYLLSI